MIFRNYQASDKDKCLELFRSLLLRVRAKGFTNGVVNNKEKDD
jgi:hypothetical protein